MLIDSTSTMMKTVNSNPIKSNLLSKDYQDKWWKIVFGHSATWITLILAVIHQSIVASSIFWLTQAIDRFQAGMIFAPLIYLYLLSMVAPYIPGTISFIYLQKWINKAHLRFINLFMAKMNGCVNKYRDTALKEQVNSVLARNSFTAIREYISFIYMLVELGLNSLLSMAVISILLPLHLLLGYTLSLVICAIVITVLHKHINVTSAKLENQQISYSNILDKSWDNATLGNQYSYDLWEKQKTIIGGDFYATSDKLAFIREFGSILLAMCSLLPTVFLIIVMIQKGQTDAFMIGALMVSLTRIFLILNSLNTVLYQVLHFISITAKLKVLFNVGTSISTAKNTINGVINNIQVNQTSIKDIAHLKQVFSDAKEGRFTITGANGSGKSTALLTLHKIYQGKGFLLPTHYTDLIWKSSTDELSTGQRLMVLIKEIASIKKIKYLFLDEWDANLDAINTKDINHMLDEISKTKVVIEVRHF